MIDRNTLREHHEDGYTLTAYCWRCDRRVELDLAALVTVGWGDVRPPMYARCNACRQRGQLTLSPPQPNWATIYGGRGGTEADGSWRS